MRKLPRERPGRVIAPLGDDRCPDTPHFCLRTAQRYPVQSTGNLRSPWAAPALGLCLGERGFLRTGHLTLS